MKLIHLLTLKPAKLFWEMRLGNSGKMAIPNKAASPFHPITRHF